MAASPTPKTSDLARLGNPIDNEKGDGTGFDYQMLLLLIGFIVVFFVVVAAFLVMKRRGSKKINNS